MPVIIRCSGCGKEAVFGDDVICGCEARPHGYVEYPLKVLIGNSGIHEYCSQYETKCLLCEDCRGHRDKIVELCRASAVEAGMQQYLACTKQEKDA